MRITTRLGTGLALAVALAVPVHAELNDGPYFNLWQGVAGNGETGEGLSVVVCGVAGGCNGDINIDGGLGAGYAIFRTAATNTGAGSGHIDPFLRFQHNEGDPNGSATTEAAFNTDYNSGPQGFKVGTIYQSGTNNSLIPGTNDTVFDGTTVAVANQAKDVDAGKDFNHAIRLGDLAVDENGFYVFRLDVNEPGGNKSNILLDELQLFVAQSNTLNQYELDDADISKTGEPVSGNLNGAKKIWDMDFNKLTGGVGQDGVVVEPDNGSAPDKRLGGIMLDSVLSSGPSNGSGDFDMEFLIHSSLFSGVGEDEFVYLYNFMGQADPNCKTTDPDCAGEASSGFEEWAVEVKTSTDPHCTDCGGNVPEPGSLFLIAAGIAGMWQTKRPRRFLARG